jgi:hypothetical protein
MSITLLSNKQLKVWNLRAEGLHYDQIISRAVWNLEGEETEIRLSGHRQICTCLKRTALQQRWEPRMKPNRIAYLSNIDIIDFQRYIEERADDLCCVYSFEAKDLAYSLHQKRVNLAIDQLKILKSQI